MDIEKEEKIICQALVSSLSTNIKEILNKYIAENPQDSILKDIKNDISDYLKKEYNSYKIEEEKNIDYGPYTGEIIKIYNRQTAIGLTVKAEYIGDTLINLEGFYLNFNELQIEDALQEQLEDIYAWIKNENTTKDDSSEDIVIYQYRNKEIIQMKYDEIRNNFSDKKMIEENSKKAKKIEQEEYEL